VDWFYFEAFWELSSMRNHGQVIGPIPWRSILDYGIWSGLRGPTLRIFSRVIRSMDSSFMGWNKKEFERISQQQRNASKAQQSAAKVARGARYTR